jgi:hypothetical protein
VRGKPARPADHERPAAQPPPDLGRVRPDRLAQQVLGGQPGPCAGRQADHVRLRGRVTQERLQQGGDQIGYIGEAVRDRAALGHVGEQREGEWMAPAEHHQPLPVGGRDTGPGEQLRAVGVVEMVERVDRHHLTPARVGAPGGCRRLAAGEDHNAVGRQGRDELLAQPAVEGAELLVPVDQQHRPTARGPDGVGESVRRRVDLAPVQQYRGPLGDARPGAHLVQQRGLADPTRAVHEQHPPGRPAGQRVVERPQLGPAADKALPPRAVDDVTEAGRRHQLSLDYRGSTDQGRRKSNRGATVAPLAAPAGTCRDSRPPSRIQSTRPPAPRTKFARLKLFSPFGPRTST